MTGARRRIEAALNRLLMNKLQKAKVIDARCGFCACPIRSGQEYRRSGRLFAHDYCISAVAAEFKPKGGRNDADLP